jgi:hypothetical protein
MRTIHQHLRRHADATLLGRSPCGGEFTMLDAQRSCNCHPTSLQRENSTVTRVKGIW